MIIRLSAIVAMSLAVAAGAVNGQNVPCRFDATRLQFEGTPVEQATCLLRPNGIGGVLSPPLKRLPVPLSEIIGRPVRIKKDSLRRYLTSSRIPEADIGGPVDNPLASISPDGSRTIPALYFVLHDTSHPYFGDGEFPPLFDSDRSWRGNDLTIWTRQPVAHVFVNRLGDSVTTTPFEQPVAKGFGTKFARDILKEPNKGLKLHIELVQPRRRDAADPNPKNDRIAPVPGFTKAQYDRLALLYVAASVRRGTWLIPGYHSAYDAGIKGAHDDPQNFELDKFAKSLETLLSKIK